MRPNVLQRKIFRPLLQALSTLETSLWRAYLVPSLSTYTRKQFHYFSKHGLPWACASSLTWLFLSIHLITPFVAHQIFWMFFQTVTIAPLCWYSKWNSSPEPSQSYLQHFLLLRRKQLESRCWPRGWSCHVALKHATQFLYQYPRRVPKYSVVGYRKNQLLKKKMVYCGFKLSGETSARLPPFPCNIYIYFKISDQCTDG